MAKKSNQKSSLWSDDPVERAEGRVLEDAKRIEELKRLCVKHRTDEIDLSYALCGYTKEQLKRDYGFERIDFPSVGECKFCIRAATSERLREERVKLAKQPKAFSMPLFINSENSDTEKIREAWEKWWTDSLVESRKLEVEWRLRTNRLVQQTFADIEPGFLPGTVKSSLEMDALL